MRFDSVFVVYLVSFGAILGASTGGTGGNPSSGGSPSPSPSSSDRWNKARNMELRQVAGGVGFSSVAKDAVDGKKDKIMFSLGEAGSLPMEFHMQYMSSDSDSKSIVSVRVAFIRLIEFVNSGSSFDGYDTSDTIVSNMTFEEGKWGNCLGPQTATVGDGSTWSYNVSYQNTFTIRLTFGSVNFTVGSRQLNPSSVKVDLLIHNYSFSRNDSYLALECRTGGPEVAEHDTYGNETRERYRVGHYAMHFGWDTSLIADNATVNVVQSAVDYTLSSGMNGSDASFQKHSFYAIQAVNPQNVEWDPVLGLEDIAATQSIKQLLLLLVLFGFLL